MKIKIRGKLIFDLPVMTLASVGLSFLESLIEGRNFYPHGWTIALILAFGWWLFYNFRHLSRLWRIHRELASRSPKNPKPLV